MISLSSLSGPFVRIISCFKSFVSWRPNHYDKTEWQLLALSFLVLIIVDAASFLMTGNGKDSYYEFHLKYFPVMPLVPGLLFVFSGLICFPRPAVTAGALFASSLYYPLFYMWIILIVKDVSAWLLYPMSMMGGFISYVLLTRYIRNGGPLRMAFNSMLIVLIGNGVFVLYPQLGFSLLGAFDSVSSCFKYGFSNDYCLSL